MTWRAGKLIFARTVPQKEDSVLGLVKIGLDIQGGVKCLLCFVIPVVGTELLPCKQKNNSKKYNSNTDSWKSFVEELLKKKSMLIVHVNWDKK